MGVFGEPMGLRYLLWLVEGFGVTLALSAAVCLAGSALGIALCCLRALGSTPVRRAASGLVGVIRNTPLLVQLFVWYFAVAALLPAGMTAWRRGEAQLGPTRSRTIGPGSS